MIARRRDGAARASRVHGRHRSERLPRPVSRPTADVAGGPLDGLRGERGHGRCGSRAPGGAASPCARSGSRFHPLPRACAVVTLVAHWRSARFRANGSKIRPAWSSSTASSTSRIVAAIPASFSGVLDLTGATRRCWPKRVRRRRLRTGDWNTFRRRWTWDGSLRRRHAARATSSVSYQDAVFMVQKQTQEAGMKVKEVLSRASTAQMEQDPPRVSDVELTRGLSTVSHTNHLYFQLCFAALLLLFTGSCVPWPRSERSAASRRCLRVTASDRRPDRPDGRTLKQKVTADLISVWPQPATGTCGGDRGVVRKL